MAAAAEARSAVGDLRAGEGLADVRAVRRPGPAVQLAQHVRQRRAPEEQGEQAERPERVPAPPCARPAPPLPHRSGHLPPSRPLAVRRQHRLQLLHRVGARVGERDRFERQPGAAVL